MNFITSNYSKIRASSNTTPHSSRRKKETMMMMMMWVKTNSGRPAAFDDVLLIRTDTVVMNQKIDKCESCNNIYSHRQSLWRHHQQNCTSSCMLFKKKKGSEMPNQHVQMKCKVCKKWMRKDNLKLSLIHI